MEEKPKDDEESSGIDIRLRGRWQLSWASLWRVLMSERFQLMALMIGLWGPQAAGNWQIYQNTESTKQTAEEVKGIAEEKADVTLQTAGKIEHELKNGLAKRIAKEVEALQSPQREAQQQQIKRLEEQVKWIREFLVGANSTEKPNTNTASLVTPAG